MISKSINTNLYTPQPLEDKLENLLHVQQKNLIWLLQHIKSEYIWDLLLKFAPHIPTSCLFKDKQEILYFLDTTITDIEEICKEIWSYVQWEITSNYAKINTIIDIDTAYHIVVHYGNDSKKLLIDFTIDPSEKIIKQYQYINKRIQIIDWYSQAKMMIDNTWAKEFLLFQATTDTIKYTWNNKIDDFIQVDFCNPKTKTIISYIP